MNSKELLSAHKTVVEKELLGRYILPQKVNDILSQLPSFFTVKTIGFSVQNRPIQSVTFGSGKTKILMWSQMHGNESTTTKSLFDFFNFLQSKPYQETTKTMLDSCTFYVIPMLNPDGSKMWTRVNANKVDLNRDAIDLSQPESKILRSVFDDFQPDYCFNLHGQRTIYGFEETGEPSVLSFLAPAAEVSKSYTFSRKRAASVITHIYKNLQSELPGQIGLYDDGYNPSCVGDTFQSMGVPTVLFEAGHYPNDYEREVTRSYVFAALITAIDAAMDRVDYPIANYLKIPQHSKCFCDVHKVFESHTEKFQFVERLKEGVIAFVPVTLEDDMGSGLFAHKTLAKSTT